MDSHCREQNYKGNNGHNEAIVPIVAVRATLKAKVAIKVTEKRMNFLDFLYAGPNPRRKNK
jgi:hypothetical protein